MTENEWYFISDLILKINSIPELDEMRQIFMKFLQILIPCDTITFFLADPDNYMRAPMVIGADPSYMEPYLHDLGKMDPKYWIFKSNQNKVYRESDLLPEEVRENHLYYQKAYLPINIYYGAIMSLSYNDTFTGVVSLYRSKEKGDFSDRDIQTLDVLKNHIAFRLYKDIFSDRQKEIRSKEKRQALLKHIADDHGLSDRETEVFLLISDGARNEDICRSLFISMGTLKKHITNIYRKIGVGSKSELLTFLINLQK